MDKVYFRHQFLKHKSFISNLKLSQNVSKTLERATDEELNLMLKILHLIGEGQIPILSKYKDTIKKAKRVQKLIQIGSRIFFKNLMKTDRNNKLKTLKQFSSLLPKLVDSLFR